MIRKKAPDLKKRTRQRLIIFLSSFALFGATYYGYDVISQRLEVLQKGKTIKTEVTRMGNNKRHNRFYVTINGKERDGGQNFGQYEDLDVGDLVEVKYLPEIEYVVPAGVKGYGSYRVVQYFGFTASLFLFLLPIFYPLLHKWKPTVFKWDK